MTLNELINLKKKDLINLREQAEKYQDQMNILINKMQDEIEFLSNLKKEENNA